MLKGESAVVTGSTSGIGLGIAQALASASVNVMPNGLRDSEQIEAARLALAQQPTSR